MKEITVKFSEVQIHQAFNFVCSQKMSIKTSDEKYACDGFIQQCINLDTPCNVITPYKPYNSKG